MTIDSEKYYSLHSIFQMKLLPWIKSFVTLRNLVLQDIEVYGGQKFKAIKTGQDQGTRYYIKGEHLTELIRQMNTSGFTINKGEQNTIKAEETTV